VNVDAGTPLDRKVHESPETFTVTFVVHRTSLTAARSLCDAVVFSSPLGTLADVAPRAWLDPATISTPMSNEDALSFPHSSGQLLLVADHAA